MMEFHVSREARDRYQFDETLFSFTGNVIFANLAASREFAYRMNQVRGAERDPARTIHPGALYAMGLIDELSHAVVEIYRREVDPAAIADALAWFDARLGPESVDRALLTFVEYFPTADVYRGEQESAVWLRGQTNGVPHRAIAFEEMMMLWLANANPAFSAFAELFDDKKLAAETAYSKIIPGFREFFATRPPIGPDKLNLIDMLRAPALASPDSLSGQLAYIQEKWAAVLGSLLDRLLLALDVLKEEDIAIWMRFHPPSAADLARRRGRGGVDSTYAAVPSYAEAAQEYERFSPDQEWMPTTVLLAKSTYVWLEQLSRQYLRYIHRLDQIPEEELALMASRGLNALWLIGVWERSRASQTIKRLCGNPDAVASAYSLYNYTVAEDLGGEEAYRHLRDRAWAHGIRLASDMVPNHMGIDSTWVIEHPEWFLSRPDPPYPAYRFEGPDLSNDGRVEIKIEDHYYDQTDAAVVFRRRDKWTGDTRYVYHGNDGTSFPWNDTAQLDYLNPATREQVIQTILQVARLFPIIRFDAAMTLAKRHFQRLWFPLPGTGGAIPSRAECSITQGQFNQAMPHEFWREVVDRVAQEVPGTLLLAEAFWLMEGYFVRTLGMHRVYNSAFMIMMRDEDNAKYRSVIKNTIEFDPDILKRYVNFMSNPDERTAIDQFGKDDKYFGVATLMATLPGLPMFGHGQIEGFTEKYGMEFRKPRYEEHPDRGMVERHQREIAPLLHRRWLFAESQNFLLYDFYRPDGSVDENVFAHSNQRGDQRALVIYHNRYATTHGTIHHSAAYADKGAGGLRRRSLGEAFHLSTDENAFMGYRDAATGLEHLERSRRIANDGLSIELQAYKRHIFLDWRELRANEQARWDQLCDHLSGRGVPDLEEALGALELVPVQDAFVALLGSDLLHGVTEASSESGSVQRTREPVPDFLGKIETRGLQFFGEAVHIYSRRARQQLIERPTSDLWGRFCDLVRAAINLPLVENEFHSPWPPDARSVLPSSSPPVPATAVWGPTLAWCALETLGEAIDSQAPAAGAFKAFEQLRLREPLAKAFEQLGVHGENSWRAAARVRIAFLIEMDEASAEKSAGLPRKLWDQSDVRWLMHVHLAEVHGDEPPVEYFNKELHEQLLWWIQIPKLIEIAAAQREDSEPLRAIGATPKVEQARTPLRKTGTMADRISAIEAEIREALSEAKRAGFRTDTLFALAAKQHQNQEQVTVRQGASEKPRVK
ncbi:MAG TPA: alpha-amylase family glycosyl hydrolase [Acidobacteriaceae bacterium]